MYVQHNHQERGYFGGRGAGRDRGRGRENYHDEKQQPTQAQQNWRGKGRGRGRGDRAYRPNVDCYNCGKHGHYARDCRSPRQVEENMNLVAEEQEKEDGVLMMAYDDTKAVRCVVYVQNRCPHAKLIDQTPQEAWSGIKPTMSHLKIFGSVAYVHVPNQRRTKLDDKSRSYVFIGYDEKTKGFRLFDPIEKKVIISRDVLMNEESTWDWNNQNTVAHEETKPSTSTPMITPANHSTTEDEEEPRQPRTRSLQDLYDTTTEAHLVSDGSATSNDRFDSSAPTIKLAGLRSLKNLPVLIERII
ncbi:hypothetical protein SASPL_147225 [Salvia splendens]|uniref:CCHC-type domain-containing protein n=1 Tax=Salvia splendens TaxID=180675 RepID=A0A8X8WE28_SALSN|nr:hypothetical protein SASPL_147225 [Salvia splendens]